MDYEEESDKIKTLKQKIVNQVEALRLHLSHSYPNICASSSSVNSVHAPKNNVPKEIVYMDKFDSHSKKDIFSEYGIDFVKIKNACVKKKCIEDIQYDYSLHAKYRKHYWPNCLIDDEKFMDYYLAYISVRDSGIPNCVGEQIPLPTKLKIKNWKKYLTDPKYSEILNCLSYGFSSGFIRPITSMDMSLYEANHKSALEYPDQVDEYIVNELKNGSLKGPFDHPPFEMCHLAPLLTVPKNDTGQRRVVLDLKFPECISVNNYIPSNTMLGKMRSHKLPRVDDVVNFLDLNNTSYFLFTCDLKNAYKHLSCDVLDFPLFTIKWKGKYYFECTVSFGARNKSLIM